MLVTIDLVCFCLFCIKIILFCIKIIKINCTVDSLDVEMPFWAAVPMQWVRVFSGMCYVLSSNERRLELLVLKGFYSVGLSCSLRPLTQVILKIGKTTSNCSYLYTKRKAKYRAVHIVYIRCKIAQ